MITLCTNSEAKLITHSATSVLDLERIKTRLQSTANLTLSLDDTLKLLTQLTEFELGQFLLENQGLNGYWTSYLILNGPKKNDLSELEYWMVHKAPVVKATQERFRIFQRIIQNRLKSGMTLLSIPCGTMDDLITLDKTSVSNIQLVGIDLDPESIALAKLNALNNECTNTSFIKKNAWELDTYETYNLITSNGLNIYEADDSKVIVLYKNFFKALKPKGILVTSFLTPPPSISKDSNWKNFDPQELKKQKAIFADIIQAKWQVFRTEAQTRKHLEAAGFKILDIIYDTQGMFPTIIAEKP
jgi:ubiquinone/menaquinone biosynthesis C-methylase UbiE